MFYSNVGRLIFAYKNGIYPNLWTYTILFYFSKGLFQCLRNFV